MDLELAAAADIDNRHWGTAMWKTNAHFAAVSLVLLAIGCGYDNGPVEQDYSDVVSANIDTDATMTDIDPGNGVGIFIEYATGGTWTLQFTCDTNKSLAPCLFSINALTLDGSSIGGVDTQSLDSEDRVNRPYSDVLTYDGTTTSELDQLSFQAAAGIPIGFDVWLQDDYYANRYVFWVGDGGLNRGVTSSSFDLYPTPAR